MANTNKNEHGSYADLSNLQNNFDIQQAKISALKELVKKTESAHGKTTFSVKENAKKIAQRLTHINSKVKARQNINRSMSETPISIEDSSKNFSETYPLNQGNFETSGSNKFLLLRQQIEENKIKIAEREINKKEFEEVVEQLKAKIDSNQQSLERSSEIGRSMTDLNYQMTGTPINSKFKSSSDLHYTPLNIDKERVKFLEKRIKGLEKQLEREVQCNNGNEVKSKIELLENKIVDLEENLKAKECIIEARTQAVGLISENLSFKDQNTLELLENAKEEYGEMEKKFLESEKSYQNKISCLCNELEDKNSRIITLEGIIEILEKNRFEMLIQNSNVEKKIAIIPLDISEDDKSLNANETQCNSITETNLQIKNDEIKNLLKKIEELEGQVTEYEIENKVLKVNFSVLEEKMKSNIPKYLFSTSTSNESNMDINKLKQNLDESNKSMIKLKLKNKQLLKQIDSFKKSSDVNNELVCVTEKNQELQQKIIELEDEKGQLQLQLLNNSGYNKLTDLELLAKIDILESTCQNQTSAIQLLQEQKLEMNEIINKIDNSTQEKVDNNEKVDILKNDQQTNNELLELLNLSNVEKNDLKKKVEHYENENTELLDKIEKLIPSSSSAESIEIVERLTQQEKLQCELELPERNVEQYDNESGRISVTLSDSLVKLREESSDLMQKIELFTIERREVLDKMDVLSRENQNNLEKVELFKQEKLKLENEIKIYLEDNIKLKKDIEILEKEKNNILIEPQTVQNKSSQPTLTTKNIFVEKSKTYLIKLYAEIDSFKKANDKNSKLQASKKLAKETKNYAQQMEELLDNFEVVQEKESCVSDRVEFEATIKNLEEEKNKFIKICDSKNKEIIALNEESTKFKNLIEEMNQNVKESEKQIQQVNILKIEHENKIKLYEKEIESLKLLNEVENQTICNSIADYELQVADNLNTISLLNNEINCLKNEIETLKTNHNDSNDKYLVELTNDKIVLKNILKQNENKLVLLNLELNNKQETINTLNDQIMDLYKTMEDNSTKLSEKEDENSFLQEIIDEKVKEINQSKLSIDELKEKNKDLQNKNMEQLEKLKKFAANIKKKAAQCLEYEEKIKVIELKQGENLTKNLNEEIDARVKDLENKIDYQEKEFNKFCLIKQQELIEVTQEKEILQKNINYQEQELKEVLKEQDNFRNKIAFQQNDFKNFSIIKEKQLNELLEEKEFLQKNNSQVNTELQNKILQLNNSQVQLEDKCKQYEMLNEEYEKHLIQCKQNAEDIEKLFNNKENCIVENKKYIDNLLNELNANNIQLENLHSAINERNQEIVNLKILNETIPENCIKEIYEQEELKCLNIILNIENLYNGLQRKIFDYIKNSTDLETQNKIYKENLSVLYKFIEIFIKRRSSIDDQLNITLHEFENNNEMLINRLKNLDEQDELIFQQFLTTQEKNEILIKEHSNLLLKYEDLENHYKSNEAEKIDTIGNISAATYFDNSVSQNNINEDLKKENLQLKDNVNYLEQIKIGYEREMNWFREQNATLSHDQFQLQEIRAQLKFSASEIENLKQQMIATGQNHETEVKMLQNQISEYDAIRMQVGKNQTDDQIFIETENKRLKELLKEKEDTIDFYQGINYNDSPQNLIEQQIQPKQIPSNQYFSNPSVSSFFSPNNENLKTSYFDEIEETKVVHLMNEGQSVNHEKNIKDLEQKISDLENYIYELTNNISKLTEINKEQLQQLQDQTENLKKIETENEKQIKILKDKIEQGNIANIESLILNEIPKNSNDSYNVIDALLPEISDTPVVEEIIVPKKQYICQPKALEEINLIDCVEELKNRIQELELEQARSESEKKKFQIKFGKMVKKLKEYKLKIEENEIVQFKKSPSVETNSLDLAIQEEMTNQITQLEQKLLDINQSFDLEKAEKQNLLKRIETLAGSNERIVEMKKQHEIEMQDLRVQIRELNKKLKNLEDWDFKNDESEKTNSSDNCNFDETILRQELNDLRTERDDLNSSLIEKTNILENLQKKLENAENSECDKNINSCCHSKSLELHDFKLENQNLKIKLSEHQGTIGNLEIEAICINRNLNNLEKEHHDEINNLNTELNLLKNSNKNYENSVNELTIRIQDLIIQIEEHKLEIEKMKKEKEESSTDEEQLSLDQKNKIISLEKIVENLKTDIEQLTKEKLNFETKLEELNDYVLSNQEVEDKLKEVILELDVKNIEITEMRNLVSIMKNSSKEETNTVKKDEVPDHQPSEIKMPSESVDEVNFDAMQNVLENQELEIVTLKEQLALRSAEYGRLIAQHDPYSQNLSSLESLKSMQNSDNKSDLDQTLYLLHQRDMQCEEMRLELVNLLEERDILQLKLSNAIRHIEDAKVFAELTEVNKDLEENLQNIPAPRSEKVPFQNNNIEMELKLSQLHSVGYMKNNEARQHEIERTQQIVAKPFSEETEITNSQQSASSILNWLWGKPDST